MTAYTASMTWRDESPLGDPPLSTTAEDQPGSLGPPLAVLSELRQILVERRAALSEQIGAIERHLARKDQQSTESLDARDGRCIAWAHTVSRIAVNCKLSLLREIDQALRRMDDGTYGFDMTTGAAIPLARLREIPWARSA